MEPEAPSGTDRKRSRRWLRWITVFIALLIPAVFGLSNLALNSQRGRDWIASRVKSRTTLDTSIGGASWSPWNGVTLRAVRIEQPAALKDHIRSPLIRVSKLRAIPEWKALLENRIELRSLTLSSPEIVLPVEIISYFAPPAPPVATPPLALNNPSPAVPAIEPPATPAQPPPAITSNTPPPAAIENPSAPPPPAPSTPLPTPAHTPPAAPVAASSKSTEFIHLENASFSLVFSASPSPLLEISGLEGSVPVGGGPADSTLTIKSLRSIGGAIADDLKLPVNWQAPLLTLPPLDITASGLKTRIGGQLAMVQGLPIAFECNAPAQSVKPVVLPGGGTFRAQDVSSVLRFAGMLISPSTWQADFVTAASKPVVVADGNETRFDHAQAVTVLRGGTLSCVDARITGDDVSMLGNATLLSNGKTAGVLRIVAPRETSLSIIRRLFPGATAPPAFSSMSTPQRAALDIEVSGSLGDLNIRLGKNGPLVGRPTPPDSAKPQ